MSKPPLIKVAYEKTIVENFTRFTLANVLGLFSFFFLAYKTFNETLLMSILEAVLVIILIFIIRFSYFAIDYYYAFIKKNLYGEAIRLLKEGFSAIHWLRSQEIDRETFISGMEFMLDQLKKIFDAKTKSECAVSIKLSVKAEPMNGESKVINICRDTDSYHRDTPAYTRQRHTIKGNTCFNHICEELGNEVQAFYVNNNIQNSPDYLNTGKSAYPRQELPYKSEIVVPLIPLYATDEDTDLIALGFLCIDSNKANVFDSKYDLDILQGAAEGMYDIIKSARNLLTIPDEVVEKTVPAKKEKIFVLKNRTIQKKRK